MSVVPPRLLSQSLIPSSYNARTYFSPGSWLALDELVFPWNGRHPLKIFIPRKPHPNGFLVYLVCCKLEEGKPLIMDIVFDWSVSPLVERRTPTEVLRTTAARLRADFDYASTELSYITTLHSVERRAPTSVPP
jgi:hypothetical protein